nr:ead/Ea22-like family protein [Klebsiella pneumoniae]
GVNTPDLPPLEHENVHYADAAEMEIEALRQRIAELESRTVKLPPRVDSSNVPFAGNAWNCCLDEVEKRLTAAGIKMEAE